MTLGSKRNPVRTAAGLILLMILGGGTSVASARLDTIGWHRQVARTARTLRATDAAHLHYVSASGALLYEEGTASGTLPGSMRVHFDVGATFSGSFTIYTRAGTIKGHGVATPHGSGVYESFAGSIVVNGGSGRYSHAHGRAGLYGTFNRNTYGLVIQTTGTLLF